MTQTIKPVYILYGSDEFLRDSSRRQVIQQAVGEADPQVCISSYDSDVELAVVLDELRTLPFLAPHRVVVISQADAFISAHREGLEKYLQSPSSNGTLILQTISWPATTRLYKLVAKAGEAINCSVPDRQDLAAWVRKAATKRGKEITDDATQMLVQWVGRDLSGLDAEIEKLSLYAHERPQIAAQDVNTLVTATAGPDAFALTNHLTTGDAAAALKTLEQMLTKRGEEFRTLGMIGWHLRKVLSAHQAIKAGASVDQAIPKMPWSQADAFKTLLRRRSLGKVLGDFRRMLKADLSMKSGAEPKAALQELIVQLCR